MVFVFLWFVYFLVENIYMLYEYLLALRFSFAFYYMLVCICVFLSLFWIDVRTISLKLNVFYFY